MEDLRPGLGALGEDAAWRWYRDRGYQLIARNWRCRLGELDLVVRRAGVLVFCEVKARRASRYGGGWEAVTARKQAKLRAVAQAYLQQVGTASDGVRFDVVSVAVRAGPMPAARSVDVEVFQDAF